jgi:uncharacterized membrane protein YbhN (UPF0104 family)
VPLVIRTSIAIFAVGALLALIGLFILARGGDRLLSPLLRLLKWAPRALVERFVGLVTRFGAGLRTLTDARQLGLALMYSALAWAVAGAATVCYVMAFHLPVPWYAGLFVLVVVNLGGAIPSSPGGIGVYHGLVVMALSIWLDDRSAALGYASASHVLNLGVYIVLGLLAAWREGIQLSTLARGDQLLAEGVPSEGDGALMEDEETHGG